MARGIKHVRVVRDDGFAFWASVFRVSSFGFGCGVAMWASGFGGEGRTRCREYPRLVLDAGFRVYGGSASGTLHLNPYSRGVRVTTGSWTGPPRGTRAPREGVQDPVLTVRAGGKASVWPWHTEEQGYTCPGPRYQGCASGARRRVWRFTFPASGPGSGVSVSGAGVCCRK